MSKLIQGLSNSAYHGDSLYLSSSNLKLLLKGEDGIREFYETKILGIRKPQKESAALLEGSLLHTLILEPDKALDEYLFYPLEIKRGKLWDEFKEGATLPIISAPQKMRVDSWVAAYNDQQEAKRLVEDASYEQSLFTNLHGIDFKVRADIINPEEGYIADLKTTSGEISDDGWSFTMDLWGYRLSAALYLLCFEKHYQKPFTFYFIPIFKGRPKSKDGEIPAQQPLCRVIKLSEEDRAIGEQDILKAVEIYKKYQAEGWTSMQHSDSIKSEGIIDRG